MSNSGIDFREEESPDRTTGSIVQDYIAQAARMRASDLFFIANEDHLAIAVRHLGIMTPLGQLSLAEGRRCQAYIKAEAGLDIAERRRPQEGRWVVPIDEGQLIDLRLNTIPTLFGEDFTLRLLERDQRLREVSNLGFTAAQQDLLTGMLASPSGLILVTGPTGAGKTATLYACLHQLNDGKRKLNTIEDPIEYQLAGVRQSQINPAVQLDFPEMLRNVLRQSPDVIMVGEIRDSITAQTAIRAANSGHLVFATLHAPVAASALQSMFALGVPPHFLATCLRGVLAQRLVRTLCPHCKVSLDVSDSPQSFDEVRTWLRPGEGKMLFSAPGCGKCLHSGYTDRVGIFEVLTVSRNLRRLVAASASAQQIEQESIAEGMLPMRLAGLLKVAQGTTSIEEIVRVVPTEHLGIED